MVGLIVHSGVTCVGASDIFIVLANLCLLGQFTGRGRLATGLWASGKLCRPGKRCHRL